MKIRKNERDMPGLVLFGVGHIYTITHTNTLVNKRNQRACRFHTTSSRRLCDFTKLIFFILFILVIATLSPPLPSSPPVLVESDTSYTLRVIKSIYNAVAPKFIGSDPAVYIRSVGDILYKFVAGYWVTDIVEPITDIIQALLF